MLGLGAYQSSSEDEAISSPKLKSERNEQPVKELQATENKAQTTPDAKQARLSEREPSGPVLGPSYEGEQSSNRRSPDGQLPQFATPSALIQDLTLPPVPNLDIPPSPPGSPDPAANAKFAHFLSLKKQGTHFNEKLASSTSLRNPSLLNKLMDHAGIDNQAQYNTSLSTEIWDPSKFPTWGFKEELLKTQKELHQKIEEENRAGQRTTIDFVSATPAESSRVGSTSGSKTRPR